MKEIGDLLREARIKGNLSLEEINETTKIRLDQLEAIEAGDFQKLPGEVYVKGFIMNFARAVGLDGHEVLQKYYELKRAAETGASPADEESPDDRFSSEERPFPLRYPSPEISLPGHPFKVEKQKARNPWRKRAVLKLVIGGLILAVLLACGLFVHNRFLAEGRSSTEAVSGAVRDETASMLPEEQTADAPAGRDGGPEGGAEPGESTQPVLLAEARAVVWVGLYEKQSGALIFEGTLRPHETREWKLTGPVQVRIGNARGLRLVFNGEDLGVLGAEGEVKTLEFSPDSVLRQE